MYKILFKWSKAIYEKCDRIVISSPSFREYFEKELIIKDKVFNVVNQPILNSTKRRNQLFIKTNTIWFMLETLENFNLLIYLLMQ